MREIERRERLERESSRNSKQTTDSSSKDKISYYLEEMNICLDPLINMLDTTKDKASIVSTTSHKSSISDNHQNLLLSTPSQNNFNFDTTNPSNVNDLVHLVVKICND